MMRDQNKQYLEAIERIKELQKELEGKENEIEAQKQTIETLREETNIYMPVQNDEVDERLAEFLNTYPDRRQLRIMFMREASGIYYFGTRRVYVKVEMNKI